MSTGAHWKNWRKPKHRFSGNLHWLEGPVCLKLWFIFAMNKYELFYRLKIVNCSTTLSNMDNRVVLLVVCCIIIFPSQLTTHQRARIFLVHDQDWSYLSQVRKIHNLITIDPKAPSLCVYIYVLAAIHSKQPSKAAVIDWSSGIHRPLGLKLGRWQACNRHIRNELTMDRWSKVVNKS